MAQEFKAGDKVKCINNANVDLEVGRIYTAKTDTDHFCVPTITLVGQGSYEFDVKRFELVRREFEVGDYVRVVHTDYPVHMPVGKIAKVVEVNENWLGLEGDDGESWCFDFGEIEKVNPEDVAEEVVEDTVEQLPDILVIEYRGTRIEVDTNAAESRTFIEAGIAYIYGVKKNA